MQEMTKRTIKALLAKTGHALDVEDFEDIQRLDRLAEKSEDIESRDELDLYWRPIIFGEFRFHPLTISSAMWVEDATSDGDIDTVLAILFASHHAQNPDVLDEIQTKRDVRKHLWSFGRRLNLTPDEAKYIIRHITPNLVDDEKQSGDGPESDEENHSKYGKLISLLCREYGNTPDYWLAAPFSLIHAMVSDFVDRQNNEYEQVNKARGKASAPMVTPSLKAYSAYKQLERKISEKWSDKTVETVNNERENQ